MNLMDGSKFLAVTAFVVAFPPVFTSVGKGEGLKLSLAILLLYLLRGALQLFVDAYFTFGRAAADKNKAVLDTQSIALVKQAGRIFVFSEIPSILVAAYVGLKYLPNWLCAPYEQVLLYSCPVIILVEGFSAMTVIISSGQLWSEVLHEQASFVKGVVVAVCAAGYAVAFGVVAKLYLTGMISTVLAATLVAVFLTLLIILTIVTIVRDHGSITDSTLLALYTTYNLWLIARSSSSSISLRSGGTASSLLGQMFTAGKNRSTSLFVSWKTVQGLIKATINMFSIEIVTTLLFQMSLFIVLARLYLRAELQESPSAASWFIGSIWPCLGRSILVAVYTYSWLLNTANFTLTAYLDPVTWRWVNIYASLLIYTYHLICPPPDESSKEYRLHYD